METRILHHLVWCETDIGEPVFFGTFPTRQLASEYIKTLNKNEIHCMGLHPSNVRISIVTYFSRKTDSMT